MPRGQRRACRGCVAEVAGLEDPAQGAERALSPGVDETVEGHDDGGDLVAHLAQHVAHRRGVAGEDLGPEPRVARRDAGHVTQALTGEADGALGLLTQAGGDDAGSQLGHVRDRGHGLVVLVRRHDPHGRADGGRQPLDLIDRGGP